MARYRAKELVDPTLETEFMIAARKLKTRDELDMGFRVLKQLWNTLGLRDALKAQATLNLVPGDAVTWDSRRWPFHYEGTVVRVAQKTVHVKTTDGTAWTVAITLLKKKKKKDQVTGKRRTARKATA